MPWCPKCRRFQEEDDLCAYCWVETVDELPTPEELAKEPKLDKEEYLISVSTDSEADVIQALLDSHEIPSLRKYRGSGGYMKVYMGMSGQGIDMFVPSNKFQDAVELLSAEPEAEANVEVANDEVANDEVANDEVANDEIEQDLSDAEPVKHNQYYERKLKAGRKLVLLILIPMIIGFAIFLIDSLRR